METETFILTDEELLDLIDEYLEAGSEENIRSGEDELVDELAVQEETNIITYQSEIDYSDQLLSIKSEIHSLYLVIILFGLLYMVNIIMGVFFDRR